MCQSELLEPVWKCVSCHDVVCTAHCSHTKLYLPHYKSLGREPGKVNKRGKIWQSTDEVKVNVRYYVPHWFYAEVYHILELSCNKQVEAVWVKHFAEPDVRATVTHCYFSLFYFPKLHAGKNSCVYLPRLRCNEVKLFSD